MKDHRVLVVAAHPDDEVLGCGGTISRMTRAGAEVYVGVLGEGVTARYSRPEDADPNELREIREKCEEAARVMGVKDVLTHDFPDNRFDSVDLLDVVKVVEGWIEQVEPIDVFSHCHGDLNIDHRIAFQASLTATRPIAGRTVRALYAFEVPSSTEWAFGQCDHTFEPSVFVNISSELDTKLAALVKYDVEARPVPHPRAPQSVAALARWRGSTAGFAAAEAFELVRRLYV